MKRGSEGNTRLLPHAKMLLVPMNFFLRRVDYALEENVLTEFDSTDYSILRGRDAHIDFLRSGGHDLASDARAFSLTSFEM